MSLRCICGRKLANTQSYSKHTGVCKSVRENRREAEKKAQEFFRKRDASSIRLRVDTNTSSRKPDWNSPRFLGSINRPLAKKNAHYDTVMSSEETEEPVAGPVVGSGEFSTNELGFGPEMILTNRDISTEETLKPPSLGSQSPPSIVDVVLDETSAGNISHFPHPNHTLSNSPQASEQVRSKRRRFLPWRRREVLPEGPGPLLVPETSASVEPAPDIDSYMRSSIQIASNIRLRLTSQIKTTPNSFGLYRIYYALPSRIPDEEVSVYDLSLSADDRIVISGKNLYSALDIQDTIWPYPNISCFLLGEWFWLQGDTKSRESLKSLIQNVLKSPDFCLQDVLDVSWDSIDKKLATRSTKGFSDDWVEHTVTIRIPTGIKKNKKKTVKDIPIKDQLFTIKGIWIRPLVSVVRETFTRNPKTKSFHLEPFKQYWEPSPGENVRVYDEIYSSDAFLKAHEDLQNSPRVPGCNLPRAVVAMMFWSDATSLAQFGDATLWPIYLYWGNQSKYERCQPSEAHVTDFILKLRRSKAATQALLTHCRRELYHAAIKLLLDEELQEAWKHGIVTEFIDGKTWRIHPQILTWSADYPEKVYLSGIKDGTTFFCTCCNVQKTRAHMLGMASDRRLRMMHTWVDSDARRWCVQMARDLIYDKGFAVDNERVKSLLEQGSWAPTENSFSAQLRFADFNYFKMLPCDLMHEVELGVWKSLLIHLIRMLWSIGSQKIVILNQRFREVPSFGRSTIRPFGDNVSDLKKLAAHNYEDILQCFLPVFENLLPEPFNGHVLTLIWELCTWHALAKLRIHTEMTLAQLDSTTTSLGRYFRHFVDMVCPAFDTHETPSEVRARNSKTSETRTHQKKDTANAPSRLSKQMNINTFKFHILGHYFSFICLYGTTDSFTTMIGETAHRVAKARYRLHTNKRDFHAQLAKLDSTVRTLKDIREDLRSKGFKISNYSTASAKAKDEELTLIRAEDAFYISTETRKYFIIGTFCEKNEYDPAVKNFLEHLKDHILTRMTGEYHPGDELEFTTAERNQLFLQHDRIYEHSTMRINYTTYDVHRQQDYINLSKGKQDIIVAANEDENSRPHPYWYAWVHGTFHANVQLHSENGRLTAPQPIYFLWVRWFGRDLEHQCGWRSRQLDRLGFVPFNDPQAFGFLDPSAVIRTCHLIPAFEHGRTKELCPPSILRDVEGNWRYFYVNRFVDRDMFMRYLGGGVGHLVAPPPSLEDPFEEESTVNTSSDEMEDAANTPRPSKFAPLGNWEIESSSDASEEFSDIDDNDEMDERHTGSEDEEITYDESTEEVYLDSSFNYL